MMTENAILALDLMRLEGICKMLTSEVESSELEAKYLSIIDKNRVDSINKAIRQLNKKQLRDILEQTSITEETVLQYFEEYRYGKKPGFVLYWAKGFMGKDVSPSHFQEAMNVYLDEFRYGADENTKSLSCHAVDNWGNSETPVLELGMNYLKKYSFVTEDNRFDSIYERIDCFAWICSKKGFVALYNMPPRIEAVVKQTLYHLFSVKLIGVSLNQKVLDTIIPPSTRKKMSLTHHDKGSDKPQKVIFSDPQLSDKQEALLTEFNGHEMSSTSYDEEIDEETTATLGVNCNRGKLYISKNLTATQFREWSIKRILAIIEFFSNVFSDEGIEKFQHLNLFQNSSSRKLTIAQKRALEKIAIAVLICRYKKLTEYPVEITPLELQTAFPKDTECSFLLMCDSCEDTILPLCPDCERSLFALVKNEVHCDYCRKKVTCLKCDSGHGHAVNDANSLLTVLIKDKLFKEIVTELQAIEPSISAASDEYIAVHNGHLKILNSKGFKRIQPRDISTFASLYSQHLSTEKLPSINATLGKLNEKCKGSTINECDDCRYKSWKSLDDLQCLMQLFTYFDDFIPQPHQGHEYGDVSIRVMFEGELRSLQGIMKSTTKKITRSSKEGREILDQAIRGFMDTRVDIVAIIAPALFDDQLSETICTLAKHMKKRVVFMDSDFMRRLALAFESKKVATLDENKDKDS